MKWRYSESFAGIGAWGKAIQRVTERHNDTSELQWYAEIDKYASNAFSAIHEVSEDLNIWDITKDADVKPMDIFFYSPPCQTFSIAGKREGTTVAKGNLFYEAAKFIEQTQPKYAIMENVKGLPTGDTKKDFVAMLMHLEDIGYFNYWKVLNTKDYGIPQNRERVFIVSIRKDLYDQGKRFEFPKKIKLKKTLKNILDSEVDKKYYLSQNAVNRLVNDEEGYSSKPKSDGDIASALMASDYKICRGMNIIYDKGKLCADFRYDEGLRIRKNGLSPCLKANMKKSVQEDDFSNPIFVLSDEEKTLKLKSGHKKGYQEASPGDVVNLDHPDSLTNRNRVPGKITNALTTSCNIGYYNGISIRKLIPVECFRLQGFGDSDYYKAVQSYDLTYGKNKDMTTKSDAQMYMRAGNSITVNVIEEILENLLYDRKQDGQQLSLF